jgi:hypothetical protein
VDESGGKEKDRAEINSATHISEERGFPESHGASMGR